MDDSVLWQIAIASTVLFCVLGAGLVAFVIRYKNIEQEHQLEIQRLIYEHEKKELTMSFNERELILQEVSEDVHDNIGQIVYLIRMNLHTIEDQSCNDEQAALIRYISELTDRVIVETRHISRALNNEYIKGTGLYTMLETETDHLNASKQLTCFLNVKGDHHSLKAEQELLVYRIAQEAIHNVLQHANAECLKIQLKYEDNGLKMVILDNGEGFDQNEVQNKCRMGLENMNKRARLLNAALEIESAPGKGCRITLTF